MNLPSAPVDDEGAGLYGRLLQRVRTAPHAVTSVGALAAFGGVSVATLTDLCRAHAHLTPSALLGRERVRAAQRRFLQSRESVIDVGVCVGVDRGSVFERQFLATTGMTATAWRALPGRTTFTLRLPVDFRADIVTRYFSRDDQQVAERVDGATVSKGIATDGGPAVLAITLQSAHRAADCVVTAAHRLSADDMARAHGTAVRMLGLGSSAPAFEARAGREPLVARLVAGRMGLRLPITATAFEGLIWAIVGQQVNVAFATQLRRQLIELAGVRIPGTNLRMHPTAAQLASVEAADLLTRKFSRSKAEYVLGAARAVASGALPIDEMQDESAVLAERRLLALRGIGPWTAHYTMLRGFGLADCVPVGDSALSEGLRRFHGAAHRPAETELRALMSAFAPHRSVATAHFWALAQERA